VENQEDVSQVITSMFRDMFNIELSERPGDSEPALDFSGCVHIAGSINLVFTLDVNDALAQRAAMALLETDQPLEAADIPEAFAELINIIAGNLTGMLEDVQFTRPVVVHGGVMQVPNARRTMRGVFQDDAGGALAYGIFPGIARHSVDVEGNDSEAMVRLSTIPPGDFVRDHLR